MSDIFSFRLSQINPRETQAMEVIEAWVKRGYSLRHIITEALLLLGKRETHSVNMDDIAEPIDRLFRLVEKLEGTHEAVQLLPSVKTNLSESFIASIRMAIKPGVRIDL